MSVQTENDKTIRDKIYNNTYKYIKDKVKITNECNKKDKTNFIIAFTTPTIGKLSKLFEYEQDVIEWRIELNPHKVNLEYPCFTLYYIVDNIELRKYIDLKITRAHNIDCRTKKIDSKQAYVFSKWLDKSPKLNDESANNIINAAQYIFDSDVVCLNQYMEEFIKDTDFIKLKENAPELFNIIN